MFFKTKILKEDKKHEKTVEVMQNKIKVQLLRFYTIKLLIGFLLLYLIYYVIFWLYLYVYSLYSFLIFRRTYYITILNHLRVKNQTHTFWDIVPV